LNQDFCCIAGVVACNTTNEDLWVEMSRDKIELGKFLFLGAIDTFVVMGQKKKEPRGELQNELLRMMVLRDLSAYFELYKVCERASEWQIILHEKEQLLPEALKDKPNVVLDGYCNPLQILNPNFYEKYVV
jgi:hypothetical protein